MMAPSPAELLSRGSPPHRHRVVPKAEPHAAQQRALEDAGGPSIVGVPEESEGHTGLGTIRAGNVYS